MKRFKKLTNYELAGLWGDIKLLSWKMEGAANKQDTVEFYKLHDQVQELRVKLQNHHAAVALEAVQS